MRFAWFRLAAGAAAVMACCYLLLAGDSVQRPTVRPLPPRPIQSQILVSQGPMEGRDYFVSKKWIIPFGTTTIDLPILMYHYIRTPPSPFTDYIGFKLSVAPDVFQAQMGWLAANAYHPVTFDDVRAYFAGVRPLPSKPVVITFDDGYADLYTAAFPILKAHAFTAVAYIVTGFVDSSRYVTRDQVVEMDRSGIEIASHTVDHPNLARSSSASIIHEVGASKQWLEALLGHPVLDFAYPSGQYNGQVIEALMAAGYDTAVTEATSTTHSRDDRYAWTRVRVGGAESLGDFAASLGPAMKTIELIEIDVETAAVQPPRDRPGS